jgi:hypothetical protein
MLSFITAQKFDPDTGVMLQDSTTQKLKFDPTTGVQILGSNQKLQSNTSEEISTSTNTKFTDFEVLEKAKHDAYDYFVGFSWSALGGPTSLVGASILSNIGGELFEEMGAFGGLIGGIYLIPRVLSKLTVTVPYYHRQFAEDNYSNRQRNLYLTEYKNETIKLRQTSIYKGQGLTCLSCVAFIALMVVSN